MVDLQNNLNHIVMRYDKDFIVVETSYAFTAEDNDNYENIIRFEERPGYSFSPESQKQRLANIMTIVRCPNRRGLGIMCWTATWTAVPGKNWENQALFDFDNRALSAMSLINQP
jgi:arabinogalactan endo-1,4-beta-galactosidase